MNEGTIMPETVVTALSALQTAFAASQTAASDKVAKDAALTIATDAAKSAAEAAKAALDTLAAKRTEATVAIQTAYTLA